MPLFVNKVMLAGNLTRDPQVRFFSNERAVADLGLAINRRYRSQDGEQKEEVTFIDVECWGRTAELVGQYLSKGRNVHIEGRLRLDQWEDKNGGGRRSKLKVVADRVDFIDSGNRSGGQAGGDQQSGGDYQGGDYQGGGAPSGGGAASSQPSAPPPVDLGDDEPPF